MEIFLKISGKQFRHIDLFCDGTSNHCLILKQKPDEIVNHIKTINSNISKKCTKRKGLSHLLLLLTQCKDNILKEEGGKWFKLCSIAYKPEKKTSLRQLIVTILTIILKRSEGIHELRSKIARLQPTFINGLLQSWRKWMEPEFECFCEYLRQFHDINLIYHEKINSVITNFLLSAIDEEWNNGRVAKAGTLYSLLPISVWEKEVPNSRSEAKGIKLYYLIALLHDLLDKLLGGYKSERDTQGYPFVFGEIFDSPKENSFEIASILINALSFMAQLFEEPTSIHLNATSLLECVFRILQIKRRKDLVIPLIQEHALEFLDILLHAIGDCLEPFYENIQCQLISHISSFENSSNKSSFVYQEQQLKILAYNALTTLLEISGGCHPVTSSLIDNLISDILPEENTLSLKKSQSGSIANVNVKKKSKQKGYTVEESSLTTSEDSSAISNLEEKLEAALRVVQAIFLYSHHSIPLNSLKMLSSSILDQIHLPSCIITRQSTCYRFDSVRKHFYEAILAYSMFPHPGCPPSYSVIMNVLSLGAQDSNVEVSKVCLDGLTQLSYITMNPQVGHFFDFNDENDEKFSSKKNDL